MITLWGGVVRLELLKQKCRGDWSRDLRVFVLFRFLRNHLLAERGPNGIKFFSLQVELATLCEVEKVPFIEP